MRLGEYNTLTTEDGKHVDVPIKRVEMHENYKWVTQINDIAIVHLARDVEFTGNLIHFLVFLEKIATFSNIVSFIFIV